MEMTSTFRSLRRSFLAHAVLVALSLPAPLSAVANPSFSGRGTPTFEGPPAPAGLPEGYTWSDWSPDGQSAIGTTRIRSDNESGLYGGFYPIRWTSEGGVALLDPPAWDSYGRGISNDGKSVAVYYQQSTARWTEGDGYERIPTQYFDTLPTGISGDGSVIFGRTASSGCGTVCVHDAFAWFVGGQAVGLGDLPGGLEKSMALSSSLDGSFIVGWGTTDDGSRAFIWDETHGMRQLDVVLAALGIDLSGWTLSTAELISDDGLTIQGNGVNPSGEQEAWIAVIPEPSTALLIGIGLAHLAARRRRRAELRSTGFRLGAVALFSLALPTAAVAAPSFSGLGVDFFNPTPPPGAPTGSRDWTPDGQFAVGSLCCGTAEYQAAAYRWSASTGTELILPGVWESFGRGISNDGRIVTGQIVGNNIEVFRWEEGVGYELIQMPDEWGDVLRYTNAGGVSGDGSLIFGFVDPVNAPPGCVPSCLSEAMTWAVTGEVMALGDFEGGSFRSKIEDASYDGSVLVGYGYTDAGQRAAIWDADRNLRELSMLLSDLGLDTTGWTLSSADYISDDGLTITGQGFNPSGEREAWIAVIPEPSTALLVSLGLIIVGARARTQEHY